MALFVLVHGAWHDGGCWRRLASEIEAAGHRVIAVDLPADDAGAAFSDYAEVVAGAIPAESDDVVLVGHSLGGLTIPLVTLHRSVSRLVFVCALLPQPGRSLVEQMGDEPSMLLPRYVEGLETDAEGRSRWVDASLAREVMYGDVNEEDASAAVAQLRWQSRTPHAEPCPLDALPTVDSTYVMCREDRLVSPEWSRRAARDRLGVEPVEMAGSHSPMLSRPDDLARAVLAA